MNVLNLLLVLLSAAVNGDPSDVDVDVDVWFKEASVVLTCLHKTSEGELTWVKDGADLEKINNNVLEIQASGGTVSGFYSCKKEKTVKHYFFIKAKVCKNCHELSGSMAGGVIFADLIFTGGVILIVYFCTQRKKDPVSSAPAPPNPDYEPLNHKTQSRDVYAGLK